MRGDSMKFYILVITVLFGCMSARALQTQSLENASDWSQARSMCTSLGNDWDLPTVSDIIDSYDSFGIYNNYMQKNLQSQNLVQTNLFWARSDEDDLNQQLVNLSQVLKVDSVSLQIDSIAHSRIRTESLKNYRNRLRENIDRISRTQAEQNFLLGFLEIYNTTDFGKQFVIEVNTPLAEQGEELAYNVSQLVPSEILLVLLKPSRVYVETQIENIGYELELLEKGIQVICVQKH